MEPIITFKERCRLCYSCVRSCPVKAIKVDNGFAQIMYDRCIGCGNCLSCPQQAKAVVDRIGTDPGVADLGPACCGRIGVFLSGVFARHNARTVGGRTEKSRLLRGA